MNPSTVLAAVLVDELVRAGVREAVLCPGSRNAPLSFALHAADAAGRLRLHVRIDERSAGFLALGLAKASGRPVPVVTTSGTAAVNLHPAMVEADYSGVAVVALTADRPVELRGVGANQSIDQTGLYGGSARRFTEVSADTHPDGPTQRAAVRDALAAATGPDRPGPVHLNVAFRDPLVPEPAPSRGAPDTPTPRPSAVTSRGRSAEEVHLGQGVRTVVVAGDGAGPYARELAESAGWPLLAEPSSGARGGPNALGTYRLLLAHLGGDVERALVLGRPTLSRPVTRLLARPDVEVVRPERRAHTRGTADSGWLRRWQEADRLARRAVETVLAGAPVCGLQVARAVAAAVGPAGLLVGGASSAIRDLDLADPWDAPPTVLANRGASGIDGTVSTAIGAALAHQRDGGGAAYALLGDLTFLHDGTGLVMGPDEPRPDLIIVVANDDGGGLFSLLEQGDPAHAAVFERVFATPHRADLRAFCGATATPYVRAAALGDLSRALDVRAPGVRVVEVPTDRSRNRDLHAHLAAAVARALAG